MLFSFVCVRWRKKYQTISICKEALGDIIRKKSYYCENVCSICSLILNSLPMRHEAYKKSIMTAHYSVQRLIQ
jgi:hypothetical protein